jgi:RNA polymerase sigma-70 factor (ECF subfamily)
MVRDIETAGDLTQDSLVKLIEGLDRYDGRSAFSTWAIRVTMNCCLSQVRKARLRRHRSLDEPAESEGSAWGDRLAGQREPSGPQRVEQAEMQAALLDGLAAIDPAMRAVLVLRDLQDLSYQQIGEVLDLPVGTVKSRLFRAREALREAAESALGGGAREA